MYDALGTFLFLHNDKETGDGRNVKLDRLFKILLSWFSGHHLLKLSVIHLFKMLVYSYLYPSSYSIFLVLLMFSVMMCIFCRISFICLNRPTFFFFFFILLKISLFFIPLITPAVPQWLLTIKRRKIPLKCCHTGKYKGSPVDAHFPLLLVLLDLSPMSMKVL